MHLFSLKNTIFYSEIIQWRYLILTYFFETLTSLKMAPFISHFLMHIIYYLHIFDFSYSRPKKN